MSDQEISTVTSAKEIIFSQTAMQQLNQIAQLMASSICTVPKHLQGNTGDCFAIALQASQWGMSPFSVAQKTHLVNGVLGYEAQLVNAVIQSSGSIRGRFHYDYKGEGTKLQCRVGATIKGEDEITWGEWLSVDTITTKNSPLWKTNPKQQMGYLQVKNWARQYCPGAILGVYSDDELETVAAEKEINPRPAESNTGDAPALQTLDELIFSIRTMAIEDFKSIDPSRFSADEKSTIRRAMTARKKEITDQQQKNVVADVVAKTVSEEKPANWEQRIKECGDSSTLQELLNQMPESVQLELDELIGDQFDLFR